MSTIPAARRYDRFEVWAPSADGVDLRRGDEIDALSPRGGGWWHLPGVDAVPGTEYAFRLSGDERWLPDPRSMDQPHGVHGPSRVVDPDALDRDVAWTGREIRGSVIYELHVGTFTAGEGGRGGTFDSAIPRLDHLVDLGVESLEIMPVAPFPGSRGWGYDGVGLYGVHEAYGGPEGLARFVAAAHRRGLAVILDVVHNHLGPAGNYLSAFGPYFTDRHSTPWGPAVNLDGEGSDEVRAFLLGSVRQWLLELGIDGLRLDAVHELRSGDSPSYLAELADAVASLEELAGRPLSLIAEDDRNDPRTVTPTARGGRGMDLQWADDVHHGVHAWITGEREGYYVDFGAADVLAQVLTRAFEHAGTYSTFRGREWGAPVDPGSEDYDGHSFVAFLQDHDQIGNRAAGDRIHAALTPAEHATAIAPILLGPFTPMLFQGEEWAASTPFAYFTDHDADLGALVTAGRTEEFSRMGWTQDVPDPQAEQTFRGSILDWTEKEVGDHAAMLRWYRRLLELRREEPELACPDLGATHCEILSEETIILHRGSVSVLVHRGAGRADVPRGTAQILASSVSVLEDVEASRPFLEGPGVLVVRRHEDTIGVPSDDPA